MYKMCNEIATRLFLKMLPFNFLSNSATHQPIFTRDEVQYPEKMSYKVFNFVHLDLRL